MEVIDNKLPKRKIKKTFRSVTGFFPSKKNGRSMAFESILEKNLFLSLEFDNSVESYLEQPIKISYQNLNRNTSYHPDCLVHYHNKKSKLIEVKYTTDLKEKEDEYKVKFDQAKEYALKNGIDFGLFTEKDVEGQTLSNMSFLYAFAFTEVNEDRIKLIASALSQGNETNINDLLACLSVNKIEQARFLPYIWKMAFDEDIHIDYMNSPITMNSMLRLYNE